MVGARGTRTSLLYFLGWFCCPRPLQTCLGDSASLFAQKSPANLAQICLSIHFGISKSRKSNFIVSITFTFRSFRNPRTINAPSVTNVTHTARRLRRAHLQPPHPYRLSLHVGEPDGERKLRYLPIPPMYRQNQFSCLGCHCSMHRDTFGQAVGVFFRLYTPIPVVLRYRPSMHQSVRS